MGIKYVRPTWDEYFFEVMHAVAKRATCDRGRSGCVIAKNNHIITTGYVGAPTGLSSCDEVGHLLLISEDESGEQHEHCVRTVHAEQNAICQAAKLGMSIDGGTLYCTMTPCRTCAMLIINSGIKHVKCYKHYYNSIQEDSTKMLFEMAGVTLSFLNEEVQEYE